MTFTSAAPKLVEQVQAWLQMLGSQRRVSPHTLDVYRRDLTQFLNFFNSYETREAELADFASLQLRTLRAFLAHRRDQGVSSRALARNLSGIKSFVRFLEQTGHTVSPAFAQIKSPKSTQNLPRPVEPEDALAMLELAGDLAGEPWEGARDRALLILLYGCGLRISEALSLTFSQAPKAGDMLLRITGKGNKQREVPLLPVVIDLVQTYLKQAPFVFEAESPLFRSRRGKPYSPRLAQMMVAKLRTALDLPDSVTPHALRHSFATHLLAGGGDLRTIQELLGHESLVSTQVYTKIKDSQIEREHAKAHPRAKRD